MTDFQRLYASLSREVEPVMLESPEALRRKGDRRSRVAVTVAAAAIAVVALILGGQWMLSSRGASVQPATTTPAPSPPSGTPTSAPTIKALTGIPSSAFLHTADTNGAEPPTDRPSDDMLPQLCGAQYASDSSVLVRKTMHLMYWATTPEPGTLPDGTFDETITIYELDGASQFMQELRDAVTACPTEQRDGMTYRNRILAGTARGDESVLIEQRYPTRDPDGNLVGGDDVRLISVVRTGVAVMVLYERGWEDGWSADQQAVDTFTEKAFSRVQAWLR